MVSGDEPQSGERDGCDRSDQPTPRPELSAFFDASPFATLLLQPDLVLIDSNAAHARLTGVPSEQLRGRPIFDVFPINEAAARTDGANTETIIGASIARVMDTGLPDEVPIQRHDLRTGSGSFEPRYWRMIHSPVIENGAVVAIRQDSWDVTETVLSEERQAAMKRMAASASGVAFWQHDVVSNLILRTPELDAICGLPPVTSKEAATPVAGDFYAHLVPIEDQEHLAANISEMVAAGTGTVRQIEHRINRPDGQERIFSVRCEVSVGPTDNPIIVGTSMDVTDLRANERYLEALLEEKEVLLGELNHRVKNSLQLVSSILSLEARSAEEGARTRLLSAAARVRAVAAVHASFYHEEDFRSVEFASHLRSFCGHLAESLAADERGISLNVIAQQTSVGADRTVPLSLIVNELVTNAFTHGFPKDAPEGATVTVTFGPSGDNRLLMTVADNGPHGGTNAAGKASFTGNNVSTSSPGLGTQLISTVARQIGADVRVDTENGWRTEIEFDA